MGAFKQYHWESKFVKHLESLNRPEFEELLKFIEKHEVQIVTNNISTSYNVKVVNATIPQSLLKEIQQFMESKGYYPTEEVERLLVISNINYPPLIEAEACKNTSSVD
jgi:hypothetical protein